MPEVRAEVRTLEAIRTTEASAESLDVAFNVNASISESERGEGSLSLKFSIDMETNPAAARLHVAGLAEVSGREEEVERLVTGREKDGTPSLFMKIYQQIYPVMYLLCGSLKIPYPAPGLIRLNRTTSEAELMEQTEPTLTK